MFCGSRFRVPLTRHGRRLFTAYRAHLIASAGNADPAAHGTNPRVFAAPGPRALIRAVPDPAFDAQRLSDLDLRAAGYALPRFFAPHVMHGVLILDTVQT